MSETAVIAIDWSGVKSEGELPGIWITAIRGANVITDRGSWSRAEAVDFVLAQRAPVVAGFDFSFGVPAWFAHQVGCRTIDEVWRSAADEGERWLAPTAPFWRSHCELPREQRFRHCEERLLARGHAPKSLFQLVGNGQVGAGSIRGMPHLARLRAAGFAIWPFDAASERMAVEIYPTLLRRMFPHLDDRDAPTSDARDARVSARVMASRAEELTDLSATTDPVIRIEGEVWVPATSP